MEFFLVCCVSFLIAFWVLFVLFWHWPKCAELDLEKRLHAACDQDADLAEQEHKQEVEELRAELRKSVHQAESLRAELRAVYEGVKHAIRSVPGKTAD